MSSEKDTKNKKINEVKIEKKNKSEAKKVKKEEVSTKEKMLNFLLNARDIIVKYFKIAVSKSIKFLKKYKYLIILDIIIFILTVFVESLYMYKVGKIIWLISTLLYIIIPTIVMAAINKVKAKEIVISIPIFYVLFLIFLNYCTMRDLYGITSGSLDKIPSFIDALFVVFAFTLIEYISAKTVSLFKRKKK